MATPFTTIFDQFSMFAKDYRLVALYNTSPSDYATYLSGWLIPAITDFKTCNQSLAYSSSSFTATLTEENVKILALIMKKYWLKKEINDITQMNLHIQDRDFRTHSENANLKEKKDLYAQELEEVSQMLVDYGLSDNTLWTTWINTGVFWTAP